MRGVEAGADVVKGARGIEGLAGATSGADPRLFSGLSAHASGFFFWGGGGVEGVHQCKEAVRSFLGSDSPKKH